MAKTNYDGSLSTLGVLSVMCAVTVAFFMTLNWLMQPKVLENPGMAAYHAPPGTRLVPLPRQSDAPELASLPENSATSYAEALTPPPSDPPKPVKQARKKPPAPKKSRQPELNRTYAQQQWGFDYGPRRNPGSWF
jgi:hypothetical protein